MLSFRSSGSSKECMVVGAGGWGRRQRQAAKGSGAGGSGRQRRAPELVFRQEPESKQELCCDTGTPDSSSGCPH